MTRVVMASGSPELNARVQEACSGTVSAVGDWNALSGEFPSPARLFLGVGLHGLPDPAGVPPAWWRRWQAGVVWADAGTAPDWQEVTASAPGWEVWVGRLEAGRLLEWCRRPAASPGRASIALPQRWGVLAVGADGQPVSLFLHLARQAAATRGPGLLVDAEWGMGELSASLVPGASWIPPEDLAALPRRRLEREWGAAILSPTVLDPEPPGPPRAAWLAVAAAPDRWQGWYLGRDLKREPVLAVLEHLELLVLALGSRPDLVPALRTVEVLHLAAPGLRMAAAGGEPPFPPLPWQSQWLQRAGVAWIGESGPQEARAGHRGAWPFLRRRAGLRAAERGPQA